MPLSRADVERFRKLKQMLGPGLAISTEPVETLSIASDEPATPSSPTECFAPRDRLPLDVLFPSLMLPRQVLRTLTHPKQLDTMLTVLPVFYSAVDSVLKSVHSRQFLLRTDHIYALLYVSILGDNKELVKIHEEMLAKKAHVDYDYKHPEHDMEDVVLYIDQITHRLLQLQRTVENFHRERVKELPPSPDGVVPAVPQLAPYGHLAPQEYVAWNGVPCDHWGNPLEPWVDEALAPRPVEEHAILTPPSIEEDVADEGVASSSSEVVAVEEGGTTLPDPPTAIDIPAVSKNLIPAKEPPAVRRKSVPPRNKITIPPHDPPAVRSTSPPPPKNVTAARSKNPAAVLSTITENTEPQEKPLPALPVEDEESSVPEAEVPSSSLIIGGKLWPDSPIDDEFVVPEVGAPSSPLIVGGKPWPDSPISDSTHDGDDFPTSDSTHDGSGGYSPVSDSTDPFDIDPHSFERPRVAPTPKTQRPGFIQRLLVLHAEFSRTRTRSQAAPPRSTTKPPKHGARPAPAAATPNAPSFAGATPRSQPQEDRPYIVRQSCIYDRIDPTSEEKINMPLPTGDSIAVRLDANGEVKAASLPALIQLLTSHHTFPVDDMCETFFLAFRLFSTPLSVLAALQARWDEQPPSTDTGMPLDVAQQRIWVHHVAYVRNCLAQLIFTWLDEYWRPLSDACILPRLRSWVLSRFRDAQLVQGITQMVVQALDRATLQVHTSRLTRALDVERQGAPPPAGPLKIVLLPQDDYRLNIAVFETTEGRERFAEQITALAHQFFRVLDPEATVGKWITGEPIFYELQKLEEEMLMFVAQSVLLATREERVSMIEFWLDVATICVDLRNFSSACAIFGGLVFSPVERLSLTILDVGIPSKEQYRQLNRLFDGANNYSVYRRALAENAYPAVPLIVVLRKDVISTNEISGPVALTNEAGAEKTLINFSAFRLIRRTICTMEACLVPYNILLVGVIQDWIAQQLAVLPRSEHDAIAERMKVTSEQLESRAPAPIKKGETWLQTVKGSVATGEFSLHSLPDPGPGSPVRLAAVQVPATKLRKNKSIASLLNLRTRR
ncbi:ras guanine nucleotide exchange factor domain-containing protein [Mycena metata]|uniref:Ras guanine nucleotide exchange factor domain-containing protein n=1 Tax=Mycena metata TaxID=1033252 RepID=A0AAD7KGZ5_9AGAR|nr:ras guanine nucleotide exchange factor domain-containing protein [Mycena metata]